MGLVRARQRPLVIAWLVCQLLALSAFVPCACCPDDVAQAGPTDRCQSADGPEHCPMASAHGAPCPMHAGRRVASAERNTGGSAAPDCVVRGVCDDAHVALASLISIPGVLVEPSPVAPVPLVSPLATSPSSALSVELALHTPPPRL